ncbi:MAG TPA: Flp pilus assembly protein CpaB [Euzebyales bacterium]|nr:Flp pilus assembly protein CpaB [Euzebyales bacterium]
MNRRRLVAILAAVLLTLVGTVIIVAYVSSAEQRARQGEELTTVLVADERIAAGTPAADLTDRVRSIEVPQYVRPGDAVEDVAALGQQVASGDILPEEPLREGRFGPPTPGGAAPGMDLPEGHQIVSVSLEPQRALGGRIRPGQEVGIMLSVDQAEVPDATNPNETQVADSATGMVLNRVPVTAVTGGLDEETGQAAAGAVMVSFAVDESDAERLVFGAEHGRIWLTEQTEDTPSISEGFRTRDNVFRDVDTGGR